MIDMELEERMSDAARELRAGLDRKEVPPFVASRSRVPMAAAAALVILVGLGVLWTAVTRADDPSGGVVVATQPEPDAPQPDAPQPDASEPESVAPDEAVTPVAPPVVETSAQRLGKLTAAQAGEFIVPVPGGSAWNSAESMIMLYRTGDTSDVSAGHVVLSAQTGEDIVDVDLSPPDIEQVYWHPTEPTLLVAIEGNGVWSFDVATTERSLMHTLQNCPAEDANAGFPSPPASTGEFAVLCGSDQGQMLVQYNLLTGVETAEPAAASVASVHMSPSGTAVVSMLDNGSALSNMSGAQTMIDLGGDAFTFVTIDGADYLAAARYDGQAVGSLVLFDLTDGSSRVVVGPDAGDVYPPPGTQLSGAGSRVVLSTSGPFDAELAGQVLIVDLVARAGDEIVRSVPHGSDGVHGYWSDVFVSMSPTGRYVMYASDTGSDRVDTYVAEPTP